MNLRSEPVMMVTVVTAILIEGMVLWLARVIAPRGTRRALIWSATSVVGVMVLAGLVVRRLVYAPRTVETIRHEARQAGIRFGVTRPEYAYRRIRELPDPPPVQ